MIFRIMGLPWLAADWTNFPPVGTAGQTGQVSYGWYQRSDLREISGRHRRSDRVEILQSAPQVRPEEWMELITIMLMDWMVYLIDIGYNQLSEP